MTRDTARTSIARRLIASVLLVELVFAVCIVMLAAGYERHSRFRSFDIMLQGRADSLLGAVQDAEDPSDNVMLDRTGLTLPPDDIYEVRDSDGRLLGRSEHWQPVDSPPAAPGRHIFKAKVHGRTYRFLSTQGLRVVDPGDKGGGKPHRVSIVYGAPTATVWAAVRKAVLFYALSSLGLVLVTGMLMAWLLHRGLAPLRQLATEAEGISVQRWSFQPPASALATRELAPLAAALAAALERLEGSFSQQRRFVSDAAHELKTAVAVVKSSLQLLHMRQRTSAEYEAGVELTLVDCERMEQIVARMLTLARVENLSHANASTPTTDIAASLAATAQQLQSMAELRRVALVLPARPPVFVALPQQECALLCSNLLLNALQHSRPHTQVHLAIADTPDPGFVELRIEDEGDGIEATLLPHVFERFSRGDPSRSRNTGGTGLGLAICKAIVDQTGGFIELRSQLGQGTTAIVRLRRVAATVQPVEDSRPLQATPSA